MNARNLLIGAACLLGLAPATLAQNQYSNWLYSGSIYILTTPALLLTGAALTAVIPDLVTASVSQAGPHGLSDVLYAYASGSNNNGSAFASFGAATTYQNTALGLVMLFGRSRMRDAEKLYEEAVAHTPADAMEKLDVELAKEEMD